MSWSFMTLSYSSCSDRALRAGSTSDRLLIQGCPRIRTRVDTARDRREPLQVVGPARGAAVLDLRVEATMDETQPRSTLARGERDLDHPGFGRGPVLVLPHPGEDDPMG